MLPTESMDWVLLIVTAAAVIIAVVKFRKTTRALISISQDEVLIKSIFDNLRNTILIALALYASYRMWNKGLSYLQDTNILANGLLAFGCGLFVLNFCHFYHFVLLPILDKFAITRSTIPGETSHLLSKDRALVANSVRVWTYLLLISVPLFTVFQAFWIVTAISSFNAYRAANSSISSPAKHNSDPTNQPFK